MVRVVAQRVRSASVSVDGEQIGAIGVGLALLVAIRTGDDAGSVDRVADKIAVMRVFEDKDGKMNLSAADINGSMLVVSQFTLYGDLHKGRRPSFVDAAPPDVGELLYERFVDRIASHGFHTERGRFGASMLVEIRNDGPVTLIVDSRDL